PNLNVDSLDRKPPLAAGQPLGHRATSACGQKADLPERRLLQAGMRTQIVCGGRKGNQEEAFALPVAVLDQDAAVRGGRRVAFLASDDDAAVADIGALAENL